MPRERVAVQEVDWVEVFPWLGLVRTISVAWDPRKLLLALLGLALTWAGWWAFAGFYKGPDAQPADSTAVDSTAADSTAAVDRLRTEAALAKPWQGGPPTQFGFIDEGVSWSPATSPRQVLARVADIPLWYARPFLRMLSADSTWKTGLLMLLCSLWTIAVWAFCGGAITRLAALRLAQDRRTSLWLASIQTLRRWPAYFFAPLFPLGGLIVFLVLPAAFAGLLARSDILFAAVGGLWGVGLLLGLLAAVFQTALLVGWPLMWATISTEATDAFDAFSRSFSYVTQRPFHFLFYIALAAALGTFGWLVVTLFAELAMYFSVWGVSWGAGQRSSELFSAAAGNLALNEDGTVASSGARAIVWWRGFLMLVVIAYGHSFLWTAASGIYLLLRRDTDATPLDDIHLDQAEDPYGLPPVKRDAAGVSVLDRESEERAGATA